MTQHDHDLWSWFMTNDTSVYIALRRFWWVDDQFIEEVETP